MTDMLETKKYTFTVEGETERWYLLWLRDRINEQEGKEYKVAIEPKVQQHPMKFAKGVNAISTPEVIHICDVESKTALHVEKFRSSRKDFGRVRAVLIRRQTHMEGWLLQ